MAIDLFRVPVCTPGVRDRDRVWDKVRARARVRVRVRGRVRVRVSVRVGGRVRGGLGTPGDGDRSRSAEAAPG